jgi:hypothetical protein
MSRIITPVRKDNPTPSAVYINPMLTNVSVAYMQDPALYVADKVFPVIPVDKQSGQYPLYNKGDFLRDEAKRRAPGTAAARGGFGITWPSYACQVDAFAKELDDQTAANYASMLAGDKDATVFATQKVMIRRELAWLTAFFGAGIWGTDLTGVASAPSAGQFLRWDVSTSDPQKDVDAAKAAQVSGGAPEPNTGAVDYLTFLALRHNPTVRAQFAYTTPEAITRDMLAAYFGLERLFVMKGVYETGLAGGTQAYALMASKGMLLCYTPSSPSLLQPSAGYTFTWNGYLGAGAAGVRVKKYREEKIESWVYEVSQAYDQRLIAADCGVFLAATIS